MLSKLLWKNTATEEDPQYGDGAVEDSFVLFFFFILTKLINI